MTVAHSAAGPSRLEVRCVMGDNELADVAYVPRPCRPLERVAMFARTLPANFQVKGDVAVLVLDQ